MRRIIRKQCFFWNEFCSKCLTKLQDHYDSKQHGLNLSRYGFIKSEVLKADECIYYEDEKDLIGFAFVLTKKPSALYITLMASFQKGFGSILIRFLEESIIYTQRYIVLRATYNSVKFYTKLGYRIFNFKTLTDYVHGDCDDEITEAIKQSSIHNLQIINNLIIEKNYMPEGSQEFPLLKYRCSAACVQFVSSRLQAKKFTC